MATLSTVLDLNNAETVRGFAEASAAVGRYTKFVERASATSLEKWLRQSEALRLEVDGQRDAAAALREKLEIEERAVKLAKQTGISLESANALTEHRLMLEKQLAAQQAQTSSQVARRGRDVGLPAIALTTAEMDRAAIATDRVNTRFREMRKAGKNGSMGILAVSQAFEDAQYGIKGVLNNIPQAIMGFGGSMGLAGAVSIAAVALVALYPAIRRVTGALDAEIVKKNAEAWEKFSKEAEKTKQQLRQTYEMEQNLSFLSKSYAQELARRIDLNTFQLDLAKKTGDALERQLSFEKQLSAARGEIMESAGGVAAPESPNASLEDLKKQLEAQRKILTAASNDEFSISQQRSQVAEEAARGDELAKKRLQELNEKMVDINRDLKNSEESLKIQMENRLGIMDKIVIVGKGALVTPGGAIAQINGGLIKGNNELQEKIRLENENIKTLEATLAIRKKNQDQVEKEIKALQEFNRIRQEESKKAVDAAQSKIDSTLAEIQSTMDAIRLLEEKIEQETQLAALEKQRREAATAQSQKNFAEEMKILKARLEGDQKTLDDIDRKRRIEEEILRLKKEQLDITDKEATALATQKANAEDAIRDQERAAKAKQETDRKTAAGIGLKQEMEVLRLRAAGREKEAEALEREFTARAEAVRLAQETNMSEADALRLIRERQALEDQINKNKDQQNNRIPRVRRSNIARDPSSLPSGFGSASLGSAYNTDLGRRVGLGPAANDRARETRPRDLDAEARRAAQTYYERNLQQNEELLTLWRTLGVA